MKTYRFYKEYDHWFIDLKWFPERYKHHLAMVAGADTLLKIESGQKSEVTLQISTKQIAGYKNSLHRKMILPSFILGAIYESKITPIPDMSIKNNHLWLCWVTLLVFGRYPKTIYYKVL